MVKQMGPFLDRTARDVMTRELVCLPRAMSMQEAARLLKGSRISGAPVVDERGRCVGVLSTTDFLAFAEKDRPKTEMVGPCRLLAPEPRGHRVPPCTSGLAQCVCTDWEVMDVEDLPREAVGSYMTGDPVVVSELTPIGVLARKMIDAHIHRVVVVDRESKPIGIVTTTDILAALAGAEERRFRGWGW